MRCRSLVLLAGGLLALIVASPVLAGKSPSQTPYPPPSSTTTTAASSSPEPPDSADANCTPETSHTPAPEVGASESYPAGDAGSVEIKRSSATDLEVVQASPEAGWTPETTTPAGPRVKVRFTEDANPDSIVRFAATLNQDGSEIHVRVTSCQ